MSFWTGFLMFSVVIAHRGASGQAPENTLAAFQRAIQMKADFIELDVRFSKDGQIIVIHDETVDRTTNGRGEVADLTRAEIQALDAGQWFSSDFKAEKVPTLEEVLLLAKPTPVRVLIEIKEGKGLPKGFESRLLEAIRRQQMERRVIVQSFDHGAIKKVKQTDPTIATAVLIDYGSADPAAEARAVGAETLALKSSLVTKEVVEGARRNGLKVFVWTVNNLSEIKKMLTLGVDGIITDYPDRVHQATK